jgi:SnoaL-like domain
MAIHRSISPEEAADRLAIRELIDAYAHCADRRNAKSQIALFTEDVHFVVYMDAKNDIPSQELHGRDALAPVFDNLNQYEVTTHFNGQSTVVLDGNKATGVSYCLAHHVSVHKNERSLMIASIRYLDRFTKIDGIWYFAQRRLLVDWIETREIAAPKV